MQTFPTVLQRSKIHIIPNGFEGEVESFAHATGDYCKILYAGTLSTYRYDSLLEGLVQLKRKAPERFARLHLQFVGEGFRELSERVECLQLGDVVDIRPSVVHAEVCRLQREAHALLVLGRTSGRKGHELVAGAKLFSYLQAGRPIIGIVPHDETRRILSRVGAQLIADANDPTEVVATFEKLLDAWSKRALEGLVPNRAACEAYSSSRQIVDLVAALDGAFPAREVMVGVPTSPQLKSEILQ